MCRVLKLLALALAAGPSNPVTETFIETAQIEDLERMIGELHSSHNAKAACPAGKAC